MLGVGVARAASSRAVRILPCHTWWVIIQYMTCSYPYLNLHNDQQQRDNPVRSAEHSIGAQRARSEGRNPTLTVALPSASMEPAWQAGACLLKAESLQHQARKSAWLNAADCQTTHENDSAARRAGGMQHINAYVPLGW